jgi:pimeloyl-ACP methyl ester carboxylesterase
VRDRNYIESSPAGGVAKGTVVLIHGLGGCAEVWEPQQRHLTAYGYRVVSVDLPCHGRSQSDPYPRTIVEFAEAVADLCRCLGIDRCAVGGHSLGGTVAYRLAIDHPDLVEKLIVINSFSELKLTGLKRRLLYAFRVGVIRVLGLQA